jgi:hypothetical protein
MNSDIGELLRESIERATAGERLHPSLAERARQRHHRRALTVRATAVTGTVAVAATVFAATIGASGIPQRAGGELSAQTTAYIAAHTERALAAVERGNLIERITSTPPRIIAWSEVAAVVKPSGRKGILHRLSSLKIVRTTSWSYRGRTRAQGFAPDGRLAIDVGPSTATRPSGNQQTPRTIAVDPNAGKWFHPLRMPATFHPGPPTCTEGVDWLAAGGGQYAPAQFGALITKALSCHLFRAAGHQQVDGVDAARLVATPRLTRQLRGEAGDTGPGATLWVNSETFLPVRLVLGRGDGSADFGWLKPTGANLATLRVHVPAGLHEVRLPVGAMLIWAAGAARTS